MANSNMVSIDNNSSTVTAPDPCTSIVNSNEARQTISVGDIVEIIHEENHAPDDSSETEEARRDIMIHTYADNSHECLTRERDGYPFKVEANDEAYASEYEELDSMPYTRERREIKDRLELELIEIDKLKSSVMIGQAEVVKNFIEFQIKAISEEDRGYGNINIPSTASINARILVNDILQAYDSHYEPFNASWIIDCTTPKN